MISEIARARKELKDAESTLKEKQAALNVLLNNHKHVWGKYRYSPIVTPPSYYDYSDRFGQYRVAMVDRPDKVEPRWMRTCEICGKVETTTRTTPKTTIEEGVRVTREEPVWN